MGDQLPLSFVSFVRQGAVSDCDCFGYTASRALATLGYSPKEPLPDRHNAKSIFAFLQEKALSKVGGKCEVVDIDTMFTRIGQAQIDHKLHFILVHKSGHICSVLGAVNMNKKQLYQIVHGENISEVILATESQIRGSDFVEAWIIDNSDSKNFPVMLGNGELRVDKLFHNFGELNPESNPQCTFTLTNNGNKDIVLRKITPSCGCASTDITEDVVLASGQNKVITVTLRPSESLYTRQKIDVLCFVKSAGHSVTIPLEIFGNQNKPMQIKSKGLRFDNLVPGKETVRTVTLSQETTELFDVTDVQFPSEQFGIKFGYEISVLSGLKEQRNIAIRLKFTLPKGAEMKSGNANVTIKTTSSKKPEIEMPVTFLQLPPFYFEPTSFSYGVIKNNSSVEKTIEVDVERIKGKKPGLVVSETPEECKVDITRVGNKFVVKSKISPKSKGIVNKKVKLKLTYDNNTEDIQVPVVAYVEEQQSK
jgi:hypothetical protein